MSEDMKEPFVVFDGEGRARFGGGKKIIPAPQQDEAPNAPVRPWIQFDDAEAE